jgi:VWFA-related protein
MPLRFSGLLPLLASLAAAQTAPPQPAAEVAAQETSITFQSKVNVVLVPVVVRDRNGKPIDNLTKEDFQLFDKGKPQSISRVAIERGGVKTIPVAPSATPAAGNPVAPAPEVVVPDYFVSLFFDDVHLTFGDLVQARKAAETFLTNNIRESDRAAIYTTSGQLAVDFTDNIDQLKAGLLRLSPHPIARASGQECPDISFYHADLIVNKHDPQALTTAEQEAYVCLNFSPPQTLKDTEPYVTATSYSAVAAGEHEAKTALSSLKDLVRRMGAMPGQRVIVMVSPGFLRLPDQSDDMSDIMDRAIKASVTISALDARGLYTDTPDISKRTVSVAAMVMKQQYERAASRANADVMAELADGTGGTFFENSNDLGLGMQRLSAVPEVTYILAFSPQNLKLDGAYHTLKVSLRNQPGASVKARRGYYAPRHLSDADEEAKEEISQALFSREEMRDIPMDIHTQFFKTSDSDANLAVITRVDVRKLRFKKTDGRNGDELVIVSALFDRNGNFLQAVSKKVTMKLKDETLAGKLNSGIAVHADFKVTTGHYVVRLVVRDAEGQAMAAQNGAVEIP